jgi:hypothetical protein
MLSDYSLFKFFLKQKQEASFGHIYSDKERTWRGIIVLVLTHAESLEYLQNTYMKIIFYLSFQECKGDIFLYNVI